MLATRVSSAVGLHGIAKIVLMKKRHFRVYSLIKKKLTGAAQFGLMGLTSVYLLRIIKFDKRLELASFFSLSKRSDICLIRETLQSKVF